MEDAWRLSKSRLDYKSNLQGEKSKATRYRQLFIFRLLRGCQNLPHSPITWVFLIVLGIAAALFGSVIDYWAHMLWKSRYTLSGTIESSVLRFLVWIFWCVVLCFLSSSCSKSLSNTADGSGLPHMKNVLSGHSSISSEILSYRTLVAKCCGTILSIGSGLSIGKEGPFIHIASILAHKLGQLGFFRSGTSKSRENFNFLRAGVAAGVTAVFGTPLGGVLFSIEVTASYYAVSNLWQAVICSSVCVLTFEIISVLKEDVLFQRTTFDGFEMRGEIFAFVVLGVISGLMSAGLSISVAKFHQLRDKYPQIFARRYAHVAVVAVSSSILMYPMSSLMMNDRDVVNEMFRNEVLSSNSWNQMGWITLLIYIIVKFTLTVLPCGMPLPCGIFTPIFTIGAVTGRLFGELIHIIFPNSQIYPAAYAVVGAASLTAASTHTVSTAVIVFELTGQLSHMLPVMLSVLVAYSIGGLFSCSIYDVLSQLSGIRVQPSISELSLDARTAQSFMVSDVPFFTRSTTYQQAQELVDKYDTDIFALCDDKSSKILLGAVSRKDIELAMYRVLETEVVDTSDDEEEEEEESHAPFLESDVKLQHEIDIDAVLNAPLSPKAKHPKAALMKFGPPYGTLSYTAVPVNPDAPQVGYYTPLDKVYQFCCISFWMQVFVVHQGRLVGQIQIDSLTQNFPREDPVVDGMD